MFPVDAKEYPAEWVELERYSSGVEGLDVEVERRAAARGEVDQHLIREGRHEQLWTALGANVLNMGLAGTYGGYAVYRAQKEYKMALAIYQNGGEKSAYLEDEHFTLKQKVEMLPRVLPFIVLLTPAGFLSDRYNKLRIMRTTAWETIGMPLTMCARPSCVCPATMASTRPAGSARATSKIARGACCVSAADLERQVCDAGFRHGPFRSRRGPPANAPPSRGRKIHSRACRLPRHWRGRSGGRG